MILISGASGLIGMALMQSLAARDEVIGFSSQGGDRNLEQCDVRDFSALKNVFLRYRPDTVIHVAGNKNLRECQDNPARCREVNVLGTSNIGRLSLQLGACLIYVSSDYVFDGENGSYCEQCYRNPQQVYGRTKVAAEDIVTSLGGIICRTSGVYDLNATRPTFLQFVLQELRHNRHLDLWSDLFNSPTHLPDLCAGIAKLINFQTPGVYHLCGPDRMSRFAFGVQIADAFGLDPTLLTSKPGQSKEPLRPLDLSIDSSNTIRLLGNQMNSVATVLKMLRSKDYA
tara:strand:- start:45 stop:899 length:855 start_codon:yes stop_codon:yes gene_type:complete